jgi:hypothetical protein
MPRILTQSQSDYPAGLTVGTRKFVEDKDVDLLLHQLAAEGLADANV